MLFTGMIIQFNTDQDTGLIMLSDGQTKEFKMSEWVDKENVPKVGLSISYEETESFKKVQILNEEEREDIDISNVTINEDDTDSTNFKSIKEYEKFYEKEGFITQANSKTSLSMKRYSLEGIHSLEVILKNNQFELTTDLYELKEVDDHIQYFKDVGYKLASDSSNENSRNISLRSYSVEEYGEVQISYRNSKMNVVIMNNGKKVF